MTKILRSAGTGSTRTLQVDTGKDVVGFYIVRDGRGEGIDLGRDAVRELVDHLDAWLRTRSSGWRELAEATLTPADTADDVIREVKQHQHATPVQASPVGVPTVMAVEPRLTGHDYPRKYSVQRYDDGSVILTPVVGVFMTEVERAAWEQWRNAKPAPLQLDKGAIFEQLEGWLKSKRDEYAALPRGTNAIRRQLLEELLSEARDAGVEGRLPWDSTDG